MSSLQRFACSLETGYNIHQGKSRQFKRHFCNCGDRVSTLPVDHPLKDETLFCSSCVRGSIHLREWDAKGHACAEKTLGLIAFQTVICSMSQHGNLSRFLVPAHLHKIAMAQLGGFCSTIIFCIRDSQALVLFPSFDECRAFTGELERNG